MKFDAMGSAMFQIFGQGFVKEILGKMMTSSDFVMEIPS